MRILLIDNNPSLERLLDQLGHRVLRASGAWQAMDRQLKHGFDLILMDPSAPGTGGLELLDLLVATAKAQQRPAAVLLVCADSDYQGLRERVLGGEVAFLRRPFTTRELMQEIDTAIARRPSVDSLDALRPAAPGDRASSHYARQTAPAESRAAKRSVA